MIFRSYRSVLLECIDSMQDGATLDDCLDKYPRHSDRLLNDLLLADRISHTPLAKSRAGAQDQGWAAAQDRIRQLRSGEIPHAPMAAPRSFGFGAILKPVAFAVVGLLFFVSAGGALAYAAQDSQPDEPLYGVKLAAEDVRLWVVFDDSRKAELLLEQSDSRMDDIVEMVSEGQAVPENALADMHSRNERAAEIMLDSPEDTTLRTNVLAQAQRQEDLLVALWPQVAPDTTPEYARTVAQLHNTRLDGGTGAVVAAVRPEELSGGIVDISGQATEIGDGVWDVGGVEVNIDERTIGRDQLQPGSSARFVLARSAGGRLYALSLYGPQDEPASTGAFVSGEVEDVTNDGIIVAGNFIPFSSTTLQTGKVRVGQRVRVKLRSTTEGVVADSVSVAGADDAEAQPFTFEGTIEGDIRSTNIWTIGGRQFEISPATSFDARTGSAVSGARVQVEAINDDGTLRANRITVLGSSDPVEVVSIVGTFDGYDEAEGIWRVSGLELIPPATGEDPALGSQVFVVTTRDGNELVVTAYESIDSRGDVELVRLQGTILDIQGATWTMEFGQVRADSTVDVSGEPEVGTRVIVWAQPGPQGGLEAVYAVVLDDTPVLTPTPSPAPPTGTPVPAQ